MGARKTKSHFITVRATFDAPITAGEARRSVWNHIHDFELYGDGKQTKREEAEDGRHNEPFSYGKLSVKKS